MKQLNNNVIFSPSLHDAFAEAGIPFPNCTLHTGRITRFSTDGTPSDDAGWCRIFPDGVGAVFGDNRTGTRFTWQQRDADAPPLSAEERAELRKQQEEARRKHDAEVAAQYATASENAARLLADSVELQPGHPYVTKKGITPFGARQVTTSTLVLPVYGPDEALQSLQFIDDTGAKQFLAKGKMKSGRMVLGEPRNGAPLIACEGWATGCSLHEATGYTTVVCFNGGNLAPVVQSLSSRYPDSRLIIAADLDESGAGKRYADDALAVVPRAVAIYPDFADGRNAGDFNDLHREEGIDPVAEQIDIALRTERITVAEVLDPQGKPVLSSNVRGLDVRDGTADTHSLDECGNAKRLADQVGNRLKYVPETKQWLVWRDGCWTWDNDGASVRSLAAQLPTVLYREAGAHLADADHFVRWARQSAKAKTITASVSLLHDFESIRLPFTRIDADNMLIGFDDGRQVVDLRSGRARPATPDDYVTKSMNVAALGDAEHASRWKQFLGEIFDGDVELIDWFQRYCGYLLTASTEEHILLFLYGRGANGKSVLAETLKRIIGDYAQAVAPETLCASNRSGSAATPELVPLIGARMVLSSETEQNAKFAQSRIKGFVAGDSMVARANYGSPITFTPMAKIIITGNHIPDYSGNDGGFERRFKIVPFTKTFPPENRDPKLAAKLLNEAPHILAWMVQGCLEWRRRGLSDTPRVILEATASYKEEQDIIGQWLAECTEPSSGNLRTTDAYDNYRVWAQDNGFRSITSRQFLSGLRDRGHETRKSNGKVFMADLSLTDFRHRSEAYAPVGMRVRPVPRPVVN
ncbi:toprim domain-containing protein [Paraburkholderia sp. NMBU_R16]|uniref:phage/plasmid primase, P4 family n=1 Tax=Paraburkholderia sp. NMBU_R16 TaxID=2698676 RepID=UPI0015641CBF|nr:phage/plasmid primase, P4 family [Paraburkholderia sp. NMBU_R16]NRO99513.1 toprim domain-containing protein [Paraburkholderia sp. NMBU_R16]